MTNYGPDEFLNWNTSFERKFSKLSENHKILEIWSTVLAVEINCNSPPPQFFSCHNLNSVDPTSTIILFSESLETYLSNSIIKILIWTIKVFANLAIPWIIAHSPRPKNDKLWPQRNFRLTFERKFSKLSENHKILEIRSTVLKLIAVEINCNSPPPSI